MAGWLAYVYVTPALVQFPPLLGSIALCPFIVRLIIIVLVVFFVPVFVRGIMILCDQVNPEFNTFYKLFTNDLQ
jgi:hypothetical protein